MCCCLSHTPNQGPVLQPRHVPWLGIKPATLWFTGWHSVHWATPVRDSPHFFELFFLHSVPIECLFVPFIPNHWFESRPVSFPSLLVPYIFSFILLSIAFISSFILWPYSIISVSILITSVFNSASDRLAISSSLSSFSGVLIYSFTWAIFLCLGTAVAL